MGMRVDGSSGASAAQSTGAASWQQRQQSFKDLFSSLQSGDLGAAQKALQSLTGGNGSVNSSSPLAPIAQALQSGDLQGAQKAAQQFQANRAAHHHHHGGASTQAVAGTTPNQPTSGPGSLLSAIA
jgi:hypothetical protein